MFDICLFTVDVKVNGLYICVCPEYLMTLADFFVKGMPEAPKAPPPSTTAAAPTQTQTTPGAQAPPAGDINLTLTVDQPEIVMVENPMNIDTNALILDVSVIMSDCIIMSLKEIYIKKRIN